MRPKLSVLSDDLIQKILTEAKRIMSETGMEIRGAGMRERLLDQRTKARCERQTDTVHARRG